MDLVAEFAEDREALETIAGVMSGIELIAGKLMDLRGVR